MFQEMKVASVGPPNTCFQLNEDSSCMNPKWDARLISGYSDFTPYRGKAATRLKFIVGHNHCNCMTNFDAVRQDACLPDTADPSFVDGFVIGSHGMNLGSGPSVHFCLWFDVLLV